MTLSEHNLKYDAAEYVHEYPGAAGPHVAPTILEEPNHFTEILWIRTLYGSDATAGNRLVRIAISFDGTDVFTWHSPVTQPPSDAYSYVWSAIGNAYASGIGDAINIALPPRLILIPNTRIRLRADAPGGSSDLFSLYRIYFRRWPSID